MREPGKAMKVMGSRWEQQWWMRKMRKIQGMTIEHRDFGAQNGERVGELNENGEWKTQETELKQFERKAYTARWKSRRRSSEKVKIPYWGKSGSAGKWAEEHEE